MLRILDKKDDATYWMQRLIGDILTELEVNDYIVTTPEERNNEDRCVITVESETTYDNQVIGRGMSDPYIMEYRIFTIRTFGGARVESGVMGEGETAKQIANTLNQILTNSSFQKHHLTQVIRTSAPKRMGNDSNGLAIYDLRVSCWFRKEKEK